MNVLNFRTTDHLVSEGRVHCRKEGRDVSVAVCLMCEWLIGLEADGKSEVVRCSPESTLAELIPAVP